MNNSNIENIVYKKRTAHAGKSDFPQIEKYGIQSDSEVDDYLFEKSRILDMEGTDRTKYTIYGILIVLPVLVISAIPDKNLPWGSNSLFVAIAIGLLLVAIEKAIILTIQKFRLQKIYNECIENYVNDVIKYEESNS